MTGDTFDMVLDSAFERLQAAERRTVPGKFASLEQELDELERELDEMAAKHEAEPAICR